MTEAQLEALAKATGEDLLVRLQPLLAHLKAETKALVERRLDQRLELERAFTRELIHAEVEPIRASERQLRAKLAAIERLVVPARKAG